MDMLSKKQMKDQTLSKLIKTFHSSMYSCRRKGMISPMEYWNTFKDEINFQNGAWRNFYVNRFTYAETNAAEDFRRTGIIQP